MFFVLRKKDLIIFLCGILFIGLSWSTFHIAAHPNMESWLKEKIVISQFPTDKKIVVLTYDDGPDPRFTPLVLDILKKHHAHASFFILGKRAENHPEIVKRISKEGHEIANHSYSHADFNRINKAAMLQEIQTTNRIIHFITGKKPLWFRPPGGFLSYQLVDICRKENLTIAYWTYQQDSKDWRPGVGAQQIANHIIKRIKPGQIIILHDGAPNGMQTAQATDILLNDLEKQSYRCVTMSELMALANKE